MISGGGGWGEGGEREDKEKKSNDTELFHMKSKNSISSNTTLY